MPPWSRQCDSCEAHLQGVPSLEIAKVPVRAYFIPSVGLGYTLNQATLATLSHPLSLLSLKPHSKAVGAEDVAPNQTSRIRFPFGQRGHPSFAKI